MMNNTGDRLLRQREPYHFQRNRGRLNAYPRPPQPNTYQPNQKPPIQGWGTGTMTYWNTIFEDYLKKRKVLTQTTSLQLGRLR